MRLKFICKIAPKAIPLCCCLSVPVFQKHCKGNIKSDIFQIITLYLTLLNIMERVIDIAALRKAKNIKQSEMAEMLGINQSQISEIERGIRPVSTKYEEILIEQFGKDVCDNFRVTSQDNRRIIDNASINGLVHQDTYNGCSQADNLQKQLDECRAELTKTKSELERAQKRIDKLMTIIENLSRG